MYQIDDGFVCRVRDDCLLSLMDLTFSISKLSSFHVVVSFSASLSYKPALLNMGISAMLSFFIGKRINTTWAVGLAPHSTHSIISRMITVGKSWQYMMSLTEEEEESSDEEGKKDERIPTSCKY